MLILQGFHGFKLQSVHACRRPPPYFQRTNARLWRYQTVMLRDIQSNGLLPASEQGKNKTTRSHLIIDGIDKSYTEWANEYGLNDTTIRMRVKYGWSGKDLLKPVKKRGE